MINNTYGLLRFTAGWCHPCKTLAKTLSGILPEFPNIIVKEINVDDDVEKSREYQIRSIPTIVLLENGVEIARLSGNQDTEKLRKFLTR